MGWLIKFLIVALLTVILSLWAYQDNGYVLIGRGQTTIEMSLALFIITLVASFVFIYSVIRLAYKFWNMPTVIRELRLQSRKLQARQTSKQGLIALAQGHWKKAEKFLTKHINFSDSPLLNYLSAARAAQKQNAPDRRDYYLALAHRSTPDADFAVELTQAELQFAAGQHEQSLATLMHLRSISPKHPHVLSLLARLYEKLNSWSDLLNLLPTLRKLNIFPPEQFEQLQLRTYREMIRVTRNKPQANDMLNLWNSIPKEFRQRHQIVIDYSNSLLLHDKQVEAEELLREAIKREWENDLVYMYGLVVAPNPQAQLQFAESLLKQHTKNPVLLLTLGRICQRLELWGKARDYLEASIGAGSIVETYCEIGRLMEQLNEKEKASNYFKQGMQLVAKNVAAYRVPEYLENVAKQ